MDPDTTIPECLQTPIAAELRGTTLAIGFDVSASMGSHFQPYWVRALKWDPVVAATKAFCSDEVNASTQASMTFFPNELATLIGPNGLSGLPGGGPSDGGAPSGSLAPFSPDAGASSTAFCAVEGYSEPDVPTTALPSHLFGSAIDAVTPPTMKPGAWAARLPL